ncbi:MAG TPA: YggT family protein [Burkholderiaceae bacterium]|nr:YggT family protein [Burkholderiaceae bacterium]
MNALWIVIETVGSLLATACLLRALAHRMRLSPHNPVSQFVTAVTDWLVQPLRKLIAPNRNNDWASVIAALLLAVVTALLYVTLSGIGRFPPLGAVLLIAVGWLIKWALHLLIGMIILQAVLSWINPHAPLAPAVNQLTDPFLAPLRKVIPPVGGVDLSPLALILIVYVVLELLQQGIGALMPKLLM